MDCPGGHGKMVLRRAKKRMTFRGVKIIVPIEQYVCTRIAMEFPEERMAYDAAHKEKIWKRQPIGAIIPYTDSAELTGL